MSWLEPSCGTQPCPRFLLPQSSGSKSAIGTSTGPEKVALPGFEKSAWNFQTWITSPGLPSMKLAPRDSAKLGEPSGGGVAPSRSDGTPQVTCGFTAPGLTYSNDAGAPASIAARSKA